MIDRGSYRLLKKLSGKLYLSRSDIDDITDFHAENRNNPHISFLLTCKFIKSLSKDDVKCPEEKELYYQITLQGIAFIQESERNVLRFWIPYGITTGIALISLLVSLLPYFPVCN